ncbi:hypothetical protein [Bacteroides sp.]
MGKFIWIIICLAIYFGGGWIIKDITFSMLEITGETTLGDIFLYECLIYSIITGVIGLVCAIIGEGHCGPIFLTMIIYFIAKELPISMGLIILYNIGNIGSIIWAICSYDELD